MPWTAGFEQENGSGNTVWAEHTNHIVMAARGNYVVDPTGGDCAVTQNSPSADKTVDVAAGDVFNNGVKRTIGAAGVDLTSAYTGMTGTQRRYVFIFVNSSGTLTSSNGAIAASGSQEPPSYPEDGVVLAMVTIAADKATIENSDIEDWRLEGPKGAVLNGNTEVAGNLDVSGTFTFGSGSLALSGDLDLNGNSLTDFGAIEFYTFANNTVAAANDIISGTITGTSFTFSDTITISASASQKIKLKSTTAGNIDVTDNSYTPSSYPYNMEFYLQINNGNGFQDYSAVATSTVSSGTPTPTDISLTSNVSTYNNSDDLGDDIQIRVKARATVAKSLGTDIDYNFDLTTAISYALATKVGDYYSFARI